MIAPLLPEIAKDMSTSVATAGQLITVFTLAYGLSSPVLTTLTGNFNRRRLLIGALGIFTLANILAYFAANYWMLMIARVLLAFSAGVYLPGANATASALVAPERRGRTIAIINGGLTVAITVGVPLGAILGHASGWRSTFAAVALISGVATLSLMLGLPREFGRHLTTATLKERLQVAKESSVLLALVTTMFWAMGTYVVYTYLALYLSAAVDLAASAMSAVLFLWGIASAVGLFLGGRFTDRKGSPAVIIPALCVMIVAFLGLSIVPQIFPKVVATVLIFIAAVSWGVSAWAFNPAQQARMIGLAGTKSSAIALSLNASFMYIGFSIGAALGSITIAHLSPIDLGWVAAGCSFIALILFAKTYQRNSSNKGE